MNETRPQPIRLQAANATKIIGVIGSLLTALAGFGILTATQDDALQGLLGAIPGIITLITTAWAAFRTANKAEEFVTPLIDPRDANEQPLVVEGRVG